MKTRTDAHDDVALRDEETITWWAMMHNMDDDRVPCNAPESCSKEASWAWHCPMGHGYLRCDHDRARLDSGVHEAELTGDTDPVCGRCMNKLEVYTIIPDPIPWLPM